MTHHEKPKDFGRYLQAQRISQGISLDAIARLTRITTACLKQIESEDMAQLPAPVFVKGFIKSYADAVGADKDEALARYEANLKAIVKTKRSQIRIKKQTPLLQRFLLAFVLLSAIVTATLLIADKYFSANHQEEPPALQEERQPQAPETAPAENIPTEPEPTQAPAEPNQPAPEPTQAPEEPTQAPAEPAPTEQVETAPEKMEQMILKLEAVEPTWLKIITDDQAPQVFNLDVGDTITLEGRSKFSLLIGNAAGIHLTLDGKNVPVPGKSGQVVTLQLPLSRR